MKRMSVVAFFCILLCVGSASGVVTIDYNYSIAADLTLTTPYNWAIVDNFTNPGRPGWLYTGNSGVVNGSVVGLYAAPYNSTYMAAPDATDYLTTPLNNQVLWSMVDLGQTYNYLGLFWGSVDTYNQIEFLNAGSVVAEGTWTGQQILSPNPANGNQSAPSTNLYVNFYNVPDFDAVRFTSFSGYGGSSPFAFELDNLAVGVIPAPGALLLGLIGLGVIRRFKSRRFV